MGRFPSNINNSRTDYDPLGQCANLGCLFRSGDAKPNRQRLISQPPDTLEELRQAHVTGAKDSVAFLKRLLDLARQLVEAERAEADGRLDQFQVLDPDKGALTQILTEYAPPDVPVIVAKVVEEVDALVRPIRGTRWQESQPGDREVRRQLRLVLKNSGLPPSGDLYDRAYAYIREHY